MRKNLAFVFLSFCSSSWRCWTNAQEEIAAAPSIDPMSEEALNYLLGEDTYLDTLDFQGNKVFSNFNYDKKKKT